MEEEIIKLKILETINKLLKFAFLFFSAPIFLLLILYFFNYSFMVLLLLLLIFGPILILYGDYLEKREKTERKVGICIVCGKKIGINKKLCLNCFKDYDLVKWNQLWSWYTG